MRVGDVFEACLGFGEAFAGEVPAEIFPVLDVAVVVVSSSANVCVESMGADRVAYSGWRAKECVLVLPDACARCHCRRGACWSAELLVCDDMSGQ